MYKHTNKNRIKKIPPPRTHYFPGALLSLRGELIWNPKQESFFLI